MFPTQALFGLVIAIAIVFLAVHFFTVPPVAIVPQSSFLTDVATGRRAHDPEGARAPDAAPAPPNATAAAHEPEEPPAPDAKEEDGALQNADDSVIAQNIDTNDFHETTAPPTASGSVPLLPSVGNRPYAGSFVDWLSGPDLLPGTVEAQELIAQMQNPVNCSDRRFFVVSLRDCGFGGVVHGLSFALARAMHKNRTLLVRPPTKWHFAPKDRTHVGLDYYFEPLSNCSLPRPGDPVQPGQYQGIRISEGSSKYGLIPHQFRGRPLAFWRAQSSRYILRRPRAWYAQHLAALMRELLPDGVPRPSICMHVRRSDKKSEAKDTPFAKYMKVADEFRQKDPALQHIFLSTEDHSVVNDTQQYPHWRFHICKEDRHNWSHDQVAAIKGGGYLADISFANMYYHMECDVLIITRKSNWCRLLEEMRLTGNRSASPTYNLSPVYAKTWY